MIRIPVRVALILTLLTTGPSLASAQATAPATVQGTQQLAGGVAQVGTTYTLYRGTSDAINYTLTGLEYSVDHALYDQGDELPPPGKKNLILHFTIQNPQTSELYVSENSIRFSGVDSKEQAVEGHSYWYDERTHQRIAMSLKPAQKIEAYTVITMDGTSSLPKLIVDDSNNTVWRYDLHDKIRPLPSGFSDPASKDGSVALDTIRARTGVYYPGTLDLRIDQVSYTTTPLLDTTPPEGGRLMVVVVTLRNPLLVPMEVYSSLFDASITNQDDLTTNDHSSLFLASRDAPLQGTMGAGKEIQVRFLIPVENGVAPKTLQVQIKDSRMYSIDTSTLK